MHGGAIRGILAPALIPGSRPSQRMEADLCEERLNFTLQSLTPKPGRTLPP